MDILVRQDRTIYRHTNLIIKLPACGKVQATAGFGYGVIFFRFRAKNKISIR